MMKNDMIKFFRMQRQIFGICPQSGEFFRLSECRISTDKKLAPDWMDKLKKSGKMIDKQENIIDLESEKLRESARKKGRAQANRVARKVDPIFTPRKLNPDDSKVIFHPVDYVVFNGMKKNDIKNLVILDRKIKSPKNRGLQNSIRNSVEKENYEWLTLRVKRNGSISEE